jgi:mono/diheme cytochrome c family protein
MTHPAMRILSTIALAALALVLLVAACGGGTSTSPAAVAAGEKVYQQTCATCHGRDAKGLPNLGRSLQANEFVADHRDGELVAFLMEGRRATDPLNTTGIDMPPRGGNPMLTQADMEHVVAFLRTLQ